MFVKIIMIEVILIGRMKFICDKRTHLFDFQLSLIQSNGRAGLNDCIVQISGVVLNNPLFPGNHFCNQDSKLADEPHLYQYVQHIEHAMSEC
ncbi:hypothetical protein SDC9_116290 [bioreactor metagenome]|uniref:Uncharacterized protein n=1 Tax=bioreactor metagenome TaxID=1076179 RepID=A0A645BVR4_9ZZZZ